MELLRKVRSRILLSGMVGILACILASGQCGENMSLAWWGILYPEYCFMEETEGEEMSSVVSEYKKEHDKGIKISFWLAKVFDW